MTDQPMTDQPVTDQPRPLRQEQEPASTEITELAPGVLRSQLPISLPGLGHVNCYLLEDDKGVAVVDPGLATKESYVALEARLKAAGYPLKRVHTVIVTHSHPDHFGGAAWLRAKSGAGIVTHKAFHVMWDPSDPPDLDIEEIAPRPRRLPWEPTPWGGPGMNMSRRRQMRVRAMRAFPRLHKLPQPSVRLDDAQVVKFARREWVAVHTPGHTDDHLCLFDPIEGCMLCGDHVLPTITPHIGGLGRSVDPLGTFFDSLDKIGAFGSQVKLALPAHGHPFADLAGRAEAIKEHHSGRLDKLRSAARELNRPATVMEMSTHLFSPRVQGAMADSETFAHLEHLRLLGEMEQADNDGVFEYVLTGA
jgi:glyoxylase-like metal-dependent hydrolase (beta-lactamase superfamily II)